MNFFFLIHIYLFNHTRDPLVYIFTSHNRDIILNNYTIYVHASPPATAPPTWHPIRKRHVPFKDCNVRGKGGTCQL